jgi:hypothetical protein
MVGKLGGDCVQNVWHLGGMLTSSPNITSESILEFPYHWNRILQ